MFGKIKILKTVENGARLSTDNGTIIADIYGINAEDRAAFIVRAVNSHAALVEALETLVEALPALRNVPPTIAAQLAKGFSGAKSALALAKGE